MMCGPIVLWGPTSCSVKVKPTSHGSEVEVKVMP